jgi:hypothetical protein
MRTRLAPAHEDSPCAYKGQRLGPNYLTPWGGATDARSSSAPLLPRYCWILRAPAALLRDTCCFLRASLRPVDVPGTGLTRTRAYSTPADDTHINGKSAISPQFMPAASAQQQHAITHSRDDFLGDAHARGLPTVPWRAPEYSTSFSLFVRGVDLFVYAIKRWI